jgi:hypothetical protein
MNLIFSYVLKLNGFPIKKAKSELNRAKNTTKISRLEKIL